MNILSFDTSTDACLVVLETCSKQIIRQENEPRQHLQLILPLIHSLMNEADLSFSELNAIAYGCGPGSFTGVRIAQGVAQGLSFGHNIPIMPMSTLALIAQSVFIKHRSEEILIALDAKQGRVCLGYYRLDEQGVMVKVEAAIVPVESLPGRVSPQSVCVGELWGSVPDATWLPSVLEPEALLRLGAHYVQFGLRDTPMEVLPGYVRSRTTSPL